MGSDMRSTALAEPGRELNRTWSSQTVYAITSLTARDACGADLADLAHGQSSIENSPHWVPDVTYHEDRSQIRTGNGPRVIASPRNLAITAARLTGATNMTASIRYQTRRPDRPLQVIKSLR